MPEWVGLVANIFAILSFFAALFAWWQSRKINRKLEHEKVRQARVIRIVLNNGVQAIEPPGVMRRSEFSRAEILGRIGMIPMKLKGNRFEIQFLNTPEFIRKINEISDAEGNSVLTIPISDEEYHQFEIPQ